MKSKIVPISLSEPVKEPVAPASEGSQDDGMWPRMFGSSSRLTASGGDFGFPVLNEEDQETEKKAS